MAAIPAACRLRWLLLSALMLPPSLSAMAMQAAVKGQDHSPGVVLAHAPASEGLAIPAEVQGWFDSAKAAAAKGDAAEALRLQKQAVAWLKAHPQGQQVFRARALINLGFFQLRAGLPQEALPPLGEAHRILQQMDPTDPEVLRFLGLTQSFLSDAHSELGRPSDALPPAQEAVQIYRRLSQINPTYKSDLSAALNNLGVQNRAVGLSRKALASTQEAVEISREIARKEPRFRDDLALALANLGQHLRDAGREEEALLSALEAVQIRRELGKANPSSRGDLASALHMLGVHYLEVGRVAEALTPLLEAVQIRRDLAAGDPSHRGSLAASLNNLGLVYGKLGRPVEAVSAGQEAVHIRKSLALADPRKQGDYARSILNLGKALAATDRRQEAHRLTEEAITIYRRLETANLSSRAELAGALNNLGTQYSELGRPQEALAPTEEAVRKYQELAAISPIFLRELGLAQSNLGVRYSELGRRQEALLSIQAAVQTQRTSGRDNPEYRRTLALSLTNLGNRFSLLGRDEEALAPTREAVSILRELAKGQPVASIDLARATNNLAMLLNTLGRRQEALTASQEAVLDYRRLARDNAALRDDLAASLSNLALLYSDLGRREEALPLSLEAVGISRERARVNPFSLGGLAKYLNNLGADYTALGRHQQALLSRQEALAILRQLARANPAFLEELARTATNLAETHVRLNNPMAALPLLRERVSSEVTYLQGQLPLVPEGRRLALLEVFGERWQIPFYMAQLSDSGAALALFTRLNRHGLLLDIQRSQALLARNGPQGPLFEQLSAVTAQLASTTLKPDQQNALLARKEQLEQELYRQLPQIKPRLVEPAQIAALLPGRGILVEFQRYRYSKRTASRYLALLLKADGTIRAIQLSQAAPIDAAVAEALAASADPSRQAEAPERLAVVSRLLIAPLQPELAGVRELFVSPDGELNRLPFAALPVASAAGGTLAGGAIVADGPTLGDVVALRMLTTGRDLLRLQQPARAGGPAVLIANPDFNNSARPAAGASSAAGPRPTQSSNPAGAGQLRGGQQRSPGVRGLTPWQPLAGTDQEARQLAPLLGSGAVISGPAATASVVLAQRAPRILHIATHGFFLADQAPASGTAPGASPGSAAPGARSGGATPEGSAPPTPSREDPLQRSGLVFAGANRPDANPSDDGYLTAAEATAMDLEGTELVTLSACETGLGGVQSGEGVYGLQRSLAVAGARSTLLSLWKVDDGLTVTFMESYYKRLKAGEGRADALRHTQSEFRNHKNSSYNDIRVWGAFQLSGDWRALPGW